MAIACDVCNSPSAHTLHFGGRCCKACAAFFRRTVALSLKYDCVSNRNCDIDFGMRLVCRYCRYQKCLSASMRPELVRSKRPNRSESEKQTDAHTSHSLNGSPSTGRLSDSTSPIGADDEDWNCAMFDQQTSFRSTDSSFDNSYDPIHAVYASTSTQIPPVIDNNNTGFELLHHYSRLETGLSSRRRIMYTETAMNYILDSYDFLQCPFTPHDLRPHDYRSFRGMLRHDFVILFDYVSQFPEFQTLTCNEKNVFYRLALAVDFIVSSAYYSYRLGIQNYQMVLTNGEYIRMDPLPLSGEEDNARQYFENEEDFSKYKALMPMNIRIWEETILPFSKLNVTFEEYVLLKALTVWHITYYKMGEMGREKCRSQRNLIIKCLSRLPSVSSNIENRVGELLMSMSYIMESVQKLTSSYILLTFFDMLNCDSMMHEMLTFKY